MDEELKELLEFELALENESAWKSEVSLNAFESTDTFEGKFQPADLLSRTKLVDSSEEKPDNFKILGKIVEDKKTFSCSTCDYKTVWKSALKSHERIIHKVFLLCGPVHVVLIG